jgi:hypothetical protein
MVKSMNKETTLVAHSGCSGYALLLMPDNEIVFKQRCQENEFRSGYRLPPNAWATIIVTYDGTVVNMYINGELYNYGKKSFTFKCDKNLDIGAYTEINDQVFNGEIAFVQIYEEPIPIAKVLDIT